MISKKRASYEDVRVANNKLLQSANSRSRPPFSSEPSFLQTIDIKVAMQVPSPARDLALQTQVILALLLIKNTPDDKELYKIEMF